MYKVQLTASVFNSDTEEVFSGWVDSNRLFELRTHSEDVNTEEFSNWDEAMAFIESKVGSVIDNGSQSGRGVYYVEDVTENFETGERWHYAAEITEG